MALSHGSIELLDPDNACFSPSPNSTCQDDMPSPAFSHMPETHFLPGRLRQPSLSQPPGHQTICQQCTPAPHPGTPKATVPWGPPVCSAAALWPGLPGGHSLCLRWCWPLSCGGRDKLTWCGTVHAYSFTAGQNPESWSVVVLVWLC